MKHPWVPKQSRELARDIDYLDRLPEAERKWMSAFLDEYYNATPHGISEPEHIAESDRVRDRLKRDLFASGLRASVDVPDTLCAAQADVSTALDTPEAQELLKKIREVRPEFDPTDGRRKAKFRSPLHERRFYSLRSQLAELLEEAC